MFVESSTPIHYLNYYLCLFRYCLRLDLHLPLGLVFDVSVPVIIQKESVAVFELSNFDSVRSADAGALLR